MYVCIGFKDKCKDKEKLLISDEKHVSQCYIGIMHVIKKSGFLELMRSL